MATAAASWFALPFPAGASPGPFVEGLPEAGAYLGLFGALVALATLLGLVLAIGLLVQAGFIFAAAEGDRQARGRALAVARRALVGLAVMGFAHLVIVLDARQGWGLLP